MKLFSNGLESWYYINEKMYISLDIGNENITENVIYENKEINKKDEISYIAWQLTAGFYVQEVSRVISHLHFLFSLCIGSF